MTLNKEMPCLPDISTVDVKKALQDWQKEKIAPYQISRHRLVKPAPTIRFLKSLNDHLWEFDRLDERKCRGSYRTNDVPIYKIRRRLTEEEWAMILEAVTQERLAVRVDGADFGWSFAMRVYTAPEAPSAPVDKAVLKLAVGHMPEERYQEIKSQHLKYDEQLNADWAFFSTLFLTDLNQELLDVYGLPQNEERERFRY